jgi:hypothetical protein
VGLVVNQTKHWQACSSEDVVVTKAHPVSISFAVEIVEEQSTTLFDVQRTYGKNTLQFAIAAPTGACSGPCTDFQGFVRYELS